MKLSEFNFELPEELIAQHPTKNRDESRLLALNKETKSVKHKRFNNILDFFKKGDCLVINNTKVIPARLLGIKKDSTTNVEILLLKEIVNNKWEAMVRPGKKLKEGSEVEFYGNVQNNPPILTAKILEVLPNGNRVVEFQYEGVFNEILDKIGLMPLPPYIKEKLEEKDRYQTVYAEHMGSSAAPTAGLHFTEEIIQQIKDIGVEIANVTLHVGIGTFRPVKVENIEEHQMHSEHFVIRKEDAEKINNAKNTGNRVIAVGTTSCRVLETVANNSGRVKECEGDTSIFIYPGYKFKVVDALITNFHLPQSSLIILVSAFAGRDFVMQAYETAIKKGYRFFSFGDVMMIQ